MTAPEHERLEANRQTINGVLQGESTPLTTPYVFDDDLLYLATGTVAQQDPDWLLARLCDKDCAFENRIRVLAQLSGPLRQEALAALCREQPNSPHLSMLPEQVTSRIDEFLLALGNENPEERSTAADNLGDFLESKTLSRDQYQRAVEALLARAEREQHEDPLEAICNALAHAAHSASAGRISDVCWEPLAESLGSLPPGPLEHALTALGRTRQVPYRSHLEAFLTHPSERIRETAQTALEELQAEGDMS